MARDIPAFKGPTAVAKTRCSQECMEKARRLGMTDEKYELLAQQFGVALPGVFEAVISSLADAGHKAVDPRDLPVKPEAKPTEIKAPVLNVPVKPAKPEEPVKVEPKAK